jgi:hypothetical protein
VKRTPLKRGAPLKRRTTLRARISEPYELRKAKKVVRARSGGRCEARIPSICTGRATEAHHIKMRSRGGKHEPENLLDACHACHQHITEHPKWATANGLIKSRYA